VIESVLPPTLRPAVSPYVGLVHRLEESLASTAEPRLFRASCELAAGGGVIGAQEGHLGGIGGAGTSRAEAAAAAVGEALERYSASFVPSRRLVVATARELGPSAVDPARFALFSDRQLRPRGFPFRRFTAETRVAWVDGRALPGGEEAWLPAELVFLGDVARGERPIGYGTSSGAACGETRSETIARGLCELLERDAFMIVWSARLSLPLLDWRGEARFEELDARYFAPTGLAYAAVDLSPFHGVPSVLGVVRAPSGCPGALGVGAGTARTLERAWLKALAEAFAARSAGAKLALLDGGDFGPFGAGLTTFEEHIRYYADPRRAVAAGFLDSGPRRTRAAEVPAVRGDFVQALCARVAAAGSSAFVVDVTSPDVAELGLVVTKVLAPELCALDVLHPARFLGGRRLYEAPRELGLRETELAESDVNPYPHPFP
jgi:ribosomal protein S12 methylthiotransferase accessory factor